MLSRFCSTRCDYNERCLQGIFWNVAWEKTTSFHKNSSEADRR